MGASKRILWVLLFPFAVLYGVIIRVRNGLYTHCWEERTYPVPIVSVGNLTVGGTGKTPHIEYLVELLCPTRRVAIVSRGYGRKTRGLLEVETTLPADKVGDEPLQFKQKFPHVRVIVSERRREGIEFLLSAPVEQRPQVVLLDDAFQHRAVNPHVNLLLVDSYRPIFSDYLLPAGRLREPRSSLKRADAAVVTKLLANRAPIPFPDKMILPSQRLFGSSIVYKEALSLTDKKPIGNRWKDKMFLVVTGIAYPQPMYDYLESLGVRYRKIVFGDHFNYSEEVFQKILRHYERLSDKEEVFFLTTEKDAVKLKELIALNPHAEKWYYLPISIQFVGEKQAFDKYILEKIEAVT